METSWYQAAKLVLESALGLSRDALHVHVGLAVFVVAVLVLRKPPHSPIPLAVVFLAAVMGEGLDLRDDLRSLGYWRWKDSVGDVVKTVFWPLVLWALARWRAIEVRSVRPAAGGEEGVRSSRS
jgi:hypothetical protein